MGYTERCLCINLQVSCTGPVEFKCPCVQGFGARVPGRQRSGSRGSAACALLAAATPAPKFGITCAVHEVNKEKHTAYSSVGHLVNSMARTLCTWLAIL